MADYDAEFLELMNEAEQLSFEKRMYDGYLARYSADMAVEEQAQQQQLQQTSNMQRRHHRRGTQEYIHLDDEDKINVATDELNYCQQVLHDLDDKFNADVQLLRAITQGIRVRIRELRKETFEFQRDVIATATPGVNENEATNFNGQRQLKKNVNTAGMGPIQTESIVRYWKDKIKLKQQLIEKLELKNRAMKAHLTKIGQHVKQKEEQEDILKPIDYHQLRIKNNQYNQKIKDCNQHLLRLKQTTGKTVQVLNTAKRSLSELLAKSKQLKKDIRDRESQKQFFLQDIEEVEQEIERERSKNKKFRVQQSNPDLPHVMDYVQQKSTMYELESAARNFQRKIEITEMAAKRARRILAQTKLDTTKIRVP